MKKKNGEISIPSSISDGGFQTLAGVWRRGLDHARSRATSMTAGPAAGEAGDDCVDDSDDPTNNGLADGSNRVHHGHDTAANGAKDALDA